VPGDLVAWIKSFCNRRKASVVVGDYESPVQDTGHAGIPQRSPLSPILYVFYNANHVQGQINKRQGSIGFTDDYNAWVAGPSVAENTRRLQTQLLPRVERWARGGGAVFEAEKTAFIHFLRPLQPDCGPTNYLVFGNKTTAPKKSVKILGVTLDSGLSMMNEHVPKAVSKAMGRCMALRKIRGVRPAQMRQMYIVAVVPTTDYAASTWYAPSCIGVKRHVVALERVQRLAARLILRAYKSVAMLVLQSEAKLQSVSDRLHERVLNHMTKLCSLAPDHPLQRCTSWFLLQGPAFPSRFGRSCRRPKWQMQVAESTAYTLQQTIMDVRQQYGNLDKQHCHTSSMLTKGKLNVVCIVYAMHLLNLVQPSSRSLTRRRLVCGRNRSCHRQANS
jgi:hypothetical protein